MIFETPIELHPGNDIRPLIVAAHLQTTAVTTPQLQKIISLHDHVVKFQKGQALLPALLIALCRQHAVDGEMRPHFPQKGDIVQLTQPVAVIDQKCPSFGKINEPLHLSFEALTIMRDSFIRHHLPHIGTPRRIAYRAGSPSHEADRAMSCSLHVGHAHQSDEMAGMQAVRRGVKTDIKSHRFRRQKAAQLLFIGALRDKPALLQRIIDVSRQLISLPYPALF